MGYDNRQFYIDGGWVDPVEPREFNVINPATEEVLSDCARGSREQLNLAVAAAKRAFPKWSKTDIGERRKLIAQIADVIEANAASLARTLTQNRASRCPTPLGK